MSSFTPAQAATPFPGINSSSKFLIYYGNDFSSTNLNLMKTFDVVVLNPNVSNCTPAVVAYLQNNGVKDVIGYISIGEDAASRAGTLSPIVGDGTGPVYCNTTTGAITYENQGIASFYVDQAYNGTSYVEDNLPDTNSQFGGYFIWPNAAWRATLASETISTTTSVRSAAGLGQITGARVSDTDTSRTDNFGFNGYFLDTLDTSGPYDNVAGYYSWTAHEMSNTVQYIHNNYPGKLILANRGFFFYNPDITSTVFGIHPYDYDIRPYVNGALFESYYLDSATADTGVTPYWNDNNLNAARKMMAESNRPDGFTVFCLDYQVNRGTTLYQQAIQQSIVDNGWTEYLATDLTLGDVNQYVENNMPAADTAAPVWSTTGTPGYVGPGTPPTYTARTGVQAVVAGPAPGSATVQWDLAQDQTGPVSYNIYVSTSSTFATSVVYKNVAYGVGQGWNLDTTTHNANQYTITGLAAGTYYFRVRAQDALGHEDTNTASVSYAVPANPSPVSNPVLDGAITVDGTLTDWSATQSFGTKANDVTGSTNQVDWNQGWVANDTGSFYFAFANANTITALNAGYTIYLDTDTNRATGFIGGGSNFPVGAEYMIQGTTLYKYAGSGTDWNWTSISSLSTNTNLGNAEIKVPRSYIGNPSSFSLFYYGDNSVFGGTTVDVYPTTALVTGGGGGYFLYHVADVTNPVTSTAIAVDGSLADWSGLTSFGVKPDDLSGSANPVDWEKAWAAHDSSNLYIAFQNANTVALGAAYNIYVDTDNNKSTGFIGGGANFPIGAEYLIQGSTIYHYTGTGTNWSWTSVGSATPSQSGNTAELKFARSLIGSPSLIKLFFYGDNTGTSGSVDVFPTTALTTTATNGFFVYRLDDVKNTVSSGAITVDGSLTDWSTLRPYPLKLDDVTGTSNPIDWEQCSVATDSSNLYFGIKNQNTVTLNYGYTIYMDTDNNLFTGFRGSDGSFPIGADDMIQGNTLYAYTGTGTTWSWTAVSTLTPGTSGSSYEVSVALSLLGSPSLFKFFLYGDNTAFGGTVIDTYPFNALTGGGALTYRVN